MGFLRASLAKQTTQSQGTGTLALIANSGETRSLQQALGTGPVRCRAMLRGQNYYEHFKGTFTAPSTLTRDEVIDSSNAGSAVNIPAGTTTDVYLLDYAQWVNDPFTGNKTLTNKDASNSWIFGGSSAATLTLPPIGTATPVIPDFWGFVKNAGTAVLTFAAAGSDTIEEGGAAAGSLLVYPGQSGHVFFDSAAALWRFVRDAFPIASNPNKFINGDMRIDQRNSGASITPTASVYSLDRKGIGITNSSKISAQQNAGSVTPPAGFSYYLGITSLSAYSVSSTDRFYVEEPIEGLNCADLNWGTANAKAATFSFWVRSSLTGAFGGSLSNSAQTRSYPFTYTINQANTWEFKTILVPGDTSGTWLTNTSTGVAVRLGLGVGSTYSGAAGSWAGTDYRSATGAVSVVGTNGATFYTTGWKFEVGSVATPFQADDYAVSFTKCRRYARRQVAIAANQAIGFVGIGSSTTQAGFRQTLDPPMRAAPSQTLVGYKVFDGTTLTSGTSFAASGDNSAECAGINVSVASGLTVSRPYFLVLDSGSAGSLLLESEL